MTEEYVKELVGISLPLISGSELERTQFVEEVIRPSVLSLWIEGCGAATIQDKVIHFNVNSNAKPVTRQPFSLRPYDERRVDFHVQQNVLSKQMIKIETAIEGLPEWSPPAFTVDQDGKGLLGRMVCAFGPVNDALEPVAYPSADPEMAFRS
jgi:hypothetical protein